MLSRKQGSISDKKGIGVAFRQGAELTCGNPAKKVALTALDKTFTYFRRGEEVFAWEQAPAVTM